MGRPILKEICCPGKQTGSQKNYYHFLKWEAVFYRTFADFHFQDYLDIIEVRKFRIAMTKLRIASQRLEVKLVDGLDSMLFLLKK